MSLNILHVLDATTTADAVESLALLLDSAREQGDGRGDVGEHHEIAILGHRSTAWLLAHAGITPSNTKIHFLPSMGWFNIIGWRALHKLISRIQPTHVHSWGISAAMAGAMGAGGGGGAGGSGGTAARIVTLTQPPETARPFVIRAIENPASVGCRGSSLKPRWTVMTHGAERELIRRGLPPERITPIPPGIAIEHPAARGAANAIREQLGLDPHDGPILLAAGDSTGRAKHDYALWAAAMIQIIFPKVRVIVREDPRHRPDHGLERLLDNLSDGNIPLLAPSEFSWDQLLSVSDVLMVCAEGFVEMGAALHAMAHGISVVGSPVDAVRDLLEDGRTGLIATSPKPRALAARVEELLTDVPLRQRLIAAARQEAAARYSPMTMVEAFRDIYAAQPAAKIAT